MELRKDEDPRLWYRSERIFRSDGRWYFHTREGIAVGPYVSQFEAEVESSLLTKRLRKEDDRETMVRIIQEFVWESVSLPTSLDNGFFTDYLVEEGITAVQS